MATSNSIVERLKDARHRAAAAGQAGRGLRAVRAHRQPGLHLGPHRTTRRQAVGRPARRDDDTGDGKQAARAIAIDLLGTLHAAVGDLDNVQRIVKVMSLVNSTPTFTEQHLVTNGCSELLVEVFGAERGSHARSAFGVAQIPLGRLRRDRDDRRVPLAPALVRGARCTQRRGASSPRSFRSTCSTCSHARGACCSAFSSSPSRSLA